MPKKYLSIVKCRYCGVEFKQKYSGNVYCSNECRLNDVKEKPRICKNCGNQFIPKAKDRTQFCSRECAYNYKHQQCHNVCKQCGKKLEIGKTGFCSIECENLYYTKECETCGKKFISKHSAKYCSQTCKQEAHKMVLSQRRKEQEKRFKPRLIVCKNCGKEFYNTYSNKNPKFCSPECSNNYDNRMTDLRRRHKAYANGKVDYSITLDKLYLRDKGICHICGKKVDMSADTNDDSYGSIDHVNPIDKGGTHTWDNVKLAHRRCNSIKSNKTIYESCNHQLQFSL